MRQVSLGLVPRPSLSELIVVVLSIIFVRVAGVSAPAFVERGTTCVNFPYSTLVSPGLRLGLR